MQPVPVVCFTADTDISKPKEETEVKCWTRHLIIFHGVATFLLILIMQWISHLLFENLHFSPSQAEERLLHLSFNICIAIENNLCTSSRLFLFFYSLPLNFLCHQFWFGARRWNSSEEHLEGCMASHPAFPNKEKWGRAGFCEHRLKRTKLESKGAICIETC